MNNYTPEKHIYDLLTAKTFMNMGYIVELLGGHFADVGGYSPALNETCIIEVKSPKEVDARTSLQTAHNVRNTPRQQIRLLMSAHPAYAANQGLMRLYGYTLSSQLYTYFKKVELHIAKLQKKNEKFKQYNLGEQNVVPYLVIPAKNEGILQSVIDVFMQNSLITAVKYLHRGKLTIARMTYKEMAVAGNAESGVAYGRLLSGELKKS